MCCRKQSYSKSGPSTAVSNASVQSSLANSQALRWAQESALTASPGDSQPHPHPRTTDLKDSQGCGQHLPQTSEDSVCSSTLTAWTSAGSSLDMQIFLPQSYRISVYSLGISQGIHSWKLWISGSSPGSGEGRGGFPMTNQFPSSLSSQAVLQCSGLLLTSLYTNPHLASDFFKQVWEGRLTVMT